MLGEKGRAELKARLQERRNQLLKEIRSAEEGMAFFEQARHAEFSEEAQEEAAGDILETLEEHERRELQDIERALLKLENETYGLCEQCGATIAGERLKAVPATRFCFDCQQKAGGQ